ncbi:MAG: malate dehydrogenase (quinone) [unclassified Hahellaceae]|nr:malate dehydrogenase (quinone) [Hahellaceae bacterium]|tara:strand:- start:34571 stop:36058 length:1488 start_codon:yes stop_codon:yes gene_type:complete
MTSNTVDVLLIGAGVMSTTMGMMLKLLDPSLKITMVERLDHVAHESTDGWNNAGTGHAAYCELNYTPQGRDGSIDIKKAININAAFEVSQQFWSYMVKQDILPDPSSFINRAPHLSFVWGEKDVAFLRKRYEIMSAHHLFADMEYSEDPRTLREWMPLVMNNRDPMQRVAATRVNYGADVDFGSLTRGMAKHLKAHDNFSLLLSHSVKDITRRKDHWAVLVDDHRKNMAREIRAKFVFIGAGGGALPLLQKSDITEAEGYGGFPVSGQWLVCKKPEIVKQHYAKVYGKAAVGAPPMSVPHLDTRIIDGESALLFGPFAGFTTRFTKEKGSIFDLFSSMKRDNFKAMLHAGLDNFDLTRYLVGEVFQSQKTRVDTLRNFFPEARDEDWHLAEAGQRVQIIKKDPVNGGKLEFGTEVVASADGSLAALLGASPGASIATQTIIDVLERCFPKRMATEAWQNRLREIVPSYGESLVDDPELLKRIRPASLKTLELDPV